MLIQIQIKKSRTLQMKQDMEHLTTSFRSQGNEQGPWCKECLGKKNHLNWIQRKFNHIAGNAGVFGRCHESQSESTQSLFQTVDAHMGLQKDKNMAAKRKTILDQIDSFRLG